MQYLLLSVLLAASACAHPGARIIGGRPANVTEFPFAVNIISETEDVRFSSGGSILSSKWILTSGTSVYEVKTFTIRLGVEDLSTDDGLKSEVELSIIHPDFEPDTLKNDLGLIGLAFPILFNDEIQPIGLPTRDVQNYALVHVIGWGDVSDDDSEGNQQLQTVAVSVISNEDCGIAFGGSQVTDGMVCVAGNYNQGTCFGDNGGPLIQYVNGNQATVVAVASFISGNGCESTDPSGFARVFPHVNWIKNVTAI